MLAWRNETGCARSFDGKRVIKYGLKGSADILGLIGPNGKLLAIEVKVGRDTQSVDQQIFEREITKLGGIYFVAHCVEDVVNKIKPILGDRL